MGRAREFIERQRSRVRIRHLNRATEQSMITTLSTTKKNNPSLQQRAIHDDKSKQPGTIHDDNTYQFMMKNLNNLEQSLMTTLDNS